MWSTLDEQIGSKRVVWGPIQGCTDEFTPEALGPAVNVADVLRCLPVTLHMQPMSCSIFLLNHSIIIAAPLLSREQASGAALDVGERKRKLEHSTRQVAQGCRLPSPGSIFATSSQQL